MKKIIGIPRALFYYKYIHLWDKFFKEIGMEVIISDPTNKQILDDGVKTCVDEACLPVKVFHGHVINLKDRVDYIFIPRFTSISKGEYVCPEFGGLPDMIRHTIKGLPPIIDTEINMRKSDRGAIKAAMATGMLLGVSRSAAKAAFTNALNCYESMRLKAIQGELPSFEYSQKTTSVTSEKAGKCKNPGNTESLSEASVKTGTGKELISPALCSKVCAKTVTGTYPDNAVAGASKANKSNTGVDEAAIPGVIVELYKDSNDQKPRIALIGHPYNVYDKYVSMDIITKLKKFNIDVVTVEMVCQKDINRQSSMLNKPMFWNYGRNAYGSALHLASESNISGMIFITSFGCGIDSFVNDFIERLLRRKSQIPFINITIDEHSGEAGFDTRLEAFVDMLRWRRTYEDNIPALG